MRSTECRSSFMTVADGIVIVQSSVAVCRRATTLVASRLAGVYLWAVTTLQTVWRTVTAHSQCTYVLEFSHQRIQRITFTFLLRARWHIRPRYDDANCFCYALAFWLGSTMSTRVVLFLFPLFSSTWSSVFRLYVFPLVSM